MISEGLLWFILDGFEFKIKGNMIHYLKTFEVEEDGELHYINVEKSINIYEFVYEVKEFISNYYKVFGTTKSTSVGWFFWIDGIDKKFVGKTEYECVIKAGEWLIDKLLCKNTPPPEERP